jgi:hypothetical protein
MPSGRAARLEVTEAIRYEREAMRLHASDT